MDSKETTEMDENIELINYTNVSPDDLFTYWTKYFPNEPPTLFKVRKRTR